jgi:MoxR-like ATPase
LLRTIIDEIDESDIDVPNDLLHIFEEGAFLIDELKRDAADSHSVETADGDRVTIEKGRVQCRAFPFVVMTSSSEREFPAPFLRRCIQLEMLRPNVDRLTEIVEQKLRAVDSAAYDRHANTIKEIIRAFDELGKERDLAVDQLLQVVLLRMKDIDPFEGVRPLCLKEHGKLINALWKSLRDGQG